MMDRNTPGARPSGSGAPVGSRDGGEAPTRRRPSQPLSRTSADEPDGPPDDFGAGLTEGGGGSTQTQSPGGRRRRRRGGRGSGSSEAAAQDSRSDTSDGSDDGDAPAKKRSTRRRRSKTRSKASGEGAGAEGQTDDVEPTAGADVDEAAPPKKKRARRSRRKPRADDAAESPSEAFEEAPAAEADADAGSDGESDGPRTKKTRRRRGSRGGRRKTARASADGDSESTATEGTADEADDEPTPAPRRRRGTRGGRRKSRAKGGPVEVESIPGEDDFPEPEEDSLPDLPDDAERIDEPRAKKKRKSRRKKASDSSSEESADEPKTTRARKKKAEPNVILVNAGDPEETRVAVVEDGQIVDFQMTVNKHQSLVNDIYRGRVVNLEPAIGAAFIDFGQGRNGFLHTSDVLTAYGDKDWSLDKLLTNEIDLGEWGEDAPADDGDADEAEEAEDDEEPRGGRGRSKAKSKKKAAKRGKKAAKSSKSRSRARPRLPITDLLKKGQSVVVQVTKDAIGDKGPTLTTYISIPGRYLVLMPSMARTGVSRKIDDEKERRRLKRILEGLDVPPDMGVIVRTAGTGATKTDLKRDLDYLMLLWESFGKRLNLGRGPAPLYEESDVAIRTIRDLFNDATESVMVDDERVWNRVKDFTNKLMPENLEKIQLHDGSRPLFHHHGIEQDFERIFSRRIDLPSGGSIVFDQTEALVAIDVNSGKTRSDGFDFEDIALKTNLDAVPEIARQIRLRDLGGIIVCDFIDMMRTANRRAVERALRAAMAPDRARSKMGRISQFGLLEMTRQRLGPGLSKMLFHNCTRCRGSGRLRTVESRTGAILRRLGSALNLKGFTQVEVRTQPEVIDYLERNYTQELNDLESRHERTLKLVDVPDQVEDCVLRYLRADGREVRPGGRRKR